MARKTNSQGFSLIVGIVIVLVVAAVGLGGWYVWDKNKKDDNANKSDKTSQNEGEDPYEGWKTATLTSPQLTFRYPADWAVTAAADDKNIEVKSPTSSGRYFAISLVAGKSQDVNLNFLGTGPGTTISNLTIDDQALYLVAQTAGNDGAVTGFGLATTPGSTNTSFGIVDSQKTNNVTMVASLTPVTPTADDDGAEYDMEIYTSHPSYQDVLKVFESLVGDLPE